MDFGYKTDHNGHILKQIIYATPKLEIHRNKDRKKKKNQKNLHKQRRLLPFLKTKTKIKSKPHISGLFIIFTFVPNQVHIYSNNYDDDATTPGTMMTLMVLVVIIMMLTMFTIDT